MINLGVLSIRQKFWHTPFLKFRKKNESTPLCKMKILLVNFILF